MNTYLQPSFFDVETRTAKLTEMGDPLVGLNAQICQTACNTFQIRGGNSVQ